jgi:hypothetical protein
VVYSGEARPRRRSAPSLRSSPWSTPASSAVAVAAIGAELGGFLVSGPCELTEITRRFGAGDYRVTAYSLEPPTLRWEVIAKGVHDDK